MHVFHLPEKNNPRIIEIDFDFITVTRFTDSGRYVKESKTIKIDNDVEIRINPREVGEYAVEFNWYWRDKSQLDGLTEEQATRIKEVMSHIVAVRKSISNNGSTLDAIEVGGQVWSKFNMNVNLGDYSVAPLFQQGLSSKYGRLYSWDGAQKVAQNYAGWEIPTVKDYERLFEYLSNNLWKELTKSMNFKLSGVYSGRLLELHGNPFAQKKDPLAFEIGGFYWTKDIEIQKGETCKQQKLIRFDGISKTIKVSSTSEKNKNMLSLRLIWNKKQGAESY